MAFSRGRRPVRYTGRKADKIRLLAPSLMPSLTTNMSHRTVIVIRDTVQTPARY